MIDPLKDGISKVEVKDHMGDDLTVVNAARVSMAKESSYASYSLGITSSVPFGEWYTLNEGDQKLIKYLAKHQHWTPFSHVMIQLRIKMHIFIARQWFKHQVGFTRNEVSRRYVDTKPEFYLPHVFRERAENVKQGSSDTLVTYHDDKTREATMRMWESQYNDMLNHGVCPEQARMILPQSMYTEFWETASLASYARLCKLRLDPHAQKEIQLYASAVERLIEPVAPYSWKALMSC